MFGRFEELSFIGLNKLNEFFMFLMVLINYFSMDYIVNIPNLSNITISFS